MSTMVTVVLTMDEAEALVGYQDESEISQYEDGRFAEEAQEAVSAIEDAIVDAKADEARERIRERVEDATRKDAR